MVDGKINLITAPDILFNKSKSLLLIQPNYDIKKGLEEYLRNDTENINIYVYNESTYDIKWLLEVSHLVSMIIIDIDNVNNQVYNFISYLLSLPNTWYKTNNTQIPWDLINKNKFFDFQDIIKVLQ